MKTAFEALAGLTGVELVALARSSRDAAPPVSTSAPAAVRAVSDPNGKRWRVEGTGWTMAPVGLVTAAEAKAICETAARALEAAGLPARG